MSKLNLKARTRKSRTSEHTIAPTPRDNRANARKAMRDITNNNNIKMNTKQQYQSSTSKASLQNQSPNKSPPHNKSSTKSHPNTNDNEKYKDGLEADDDSDATTCDGSIDLLADDSQPSDKQKQRHGINKQASLQNNRGAEDSQSMASVSPATQILDRLSMFDSQEGGAELCIHLLKNTNDNDVVDKNGVCAANNNIANAKSSGVRGGVSDNAGKTNGDANSSGVRKTNGSGDQQPQQQQIIQDLKEYFMSTNNSSIYAEQSSFIPPLVPFCHKCNSASTSSASASDSTAVQSQLSQPTTLTQSTTTSRTIPHHSLCPHNPDFYNSGSYEILNLIIDGNLLGCSSCIYQFQNGKLNKQLVHEGGCKRGGIGGKKKKGGSGSKGGKGNSRGSKSMISSPLPKSIIGGRGGSSTRPNVQLTPQTRTSNSTKSTATTLDHQQKKTTLGQQKITNATNFDGPFDVGTIVYIEDRMWPGRNDPGGVARVVKVHHTKTSVECRPDSDGSKRTYDVKYVLESRKEKNVEEDYMTLHTDYVSPSKDCSGGLICEGSQEGMNASAVGSGGDGGINNNEMQLASPALVDANGHPLSEYERLRLRNIQRNKARLASLGLLVPPGQQQGGGSSNNGKATTTSSRVSLEEAAKSGCKKCVTQVETGEKNSLSHDLNCPRKMRGKQPDNIERRSQPKRQKKGNQQSDEDGKPKGRASVAEGAKSGCRKCIKELETGEKTRGFKHDVNCPRKEVPATLAEGAKSGCKKCVAELETGKKTGKPHDLNCPRKLAPREKKTNKEDKSDHQSPIQEDEGDVLGYLNRRPQNNKQLPSTHNTAPSLMDGAKSGCQKCTLEWQTDEVNPSMSHDDCCPRVEKRAAPPSNNRPQLHSQNRGGSGSGSQRKQTLLNKGRSSTASTLAIGSRGAAGSFNSRNYSSSAPSSSVVKATSHSSTHRTYQPTPSPVPQSSSKRNHNQPPPQQRHPPQLPAWIREFISEADKHNRDFTIPPKSKWLPCPNPWGKIGHEEDDVVIMSPFESESTSDILSVFHQGPNRSLPKRFVANPFEEGSPYHDTHTSPSRGGYSVLRLTRDRMSLRPWGFTVRLHEFGGACLVDSIEPSSPAESAVDISGWSSVDDGTSSSGLKLHDMIICVNGKSVGSMTMPELIIELDVCGPEMMLVVSRFDIKESIAGGNKESMTLEDLAMDWTDIGRSSNNNNSSLKRKRVSFENEQLGSSSSGDKKFEMNVGRTHLQNDERVGSQFNDDEEKESEYSVGQVENRIAKNDWQSPMREVLDASMEKTHRKQAVAHPVPNRRIMSGGGEKRYTNDDDSDEEEDDNVHNSKYSKKVAHFVPKHHESIDREKTHDDDEDMQISKSKKWPLRGISKPDKHDCVGGSGAAVKWKEHPGNVKYKQTIEDNHDSYKAPSTEKGALSMEIVQEWRALDPPGRFLKLNKQTKLYDDIGDKEANKKVTQSFSNKSRDESNNASKKKTTTNRYQKQFEEESSDDESEILPKRKRAVHKRKVVQPSIKDDDDDSVVNSDNDNDDNQQWKDGNGEDDPWLGCVCGQTHPRPIKVFWVQCEGCDAWYNVAEECVGFDADAAEDLDEWRCWACDPPVEGMGL